MQENVIILFPSLQNRRYFFAFFGGEHEANEERETRAMGKSRSTSALYSPKKHEKKSACSAGYLFPRASINQVAISMVNDGAAGLLGMKLTFY